VAKKSKIAKNEKIKHLVAQYRAKRIALKKIISHPDTEYEEREEAVRKLNQLPKNSSPIRYRNRCGLTGRPRGYYRKFNLSRIALRELAHDGKLPGVTKSSW